MRLFRCVELEESDYIPLSAEDNKSLAFYKVKWQSLDPIATCSVSAVLSGSRESSERRRKPLGNFPQSQL
jgi:hypothetical protein